MESIPEDAVHSIKAHNDLQLVGLNAILILLQRVQYTAYKHSMRLVGLDAKSSCTHMFRDVHAESMSCIDE